MMKDYDVKLYRGWPETSGDTLEEMLEKGSLTPVSDRGDGLYDLMPGIYSCHMTGEDIYPTLKVLSIKDDSIGICPKTLTENAVVHLKKEKGMPQGYQPTSVVADAPEFFKRTQKDELLCIWPDEILDLYADSKIPEHHQCMDQKTLEQRMESLENQYLHKYKMGQSRHYGFSIPMAVLSKEKLQGNCWQEDLTCLQKSEKVNILYQAQIHGNEPAACDGALEVLNAFCEDEELESSLDSINLVVVPRVNPEAAYLYRRMAYDNIDLNRDHMACDAYETGLLHQAFQLLEPEAVLDGHEFTFFVTEEEEGRGYVAKGCEIMSSPATGLNIDEAVRDCSYVVCGRVFEELKASGYRINHFGPAEKSSLGRGFYGLNQCLSFLIETRGIGGGRYGYAKRVKAQRDIMLSYIRHIAADYRHIKAVIAKARKRTAGPGRLVLHHGSSEKSFTPYKGVNEQFYLDGTLRARIEEGLSLKDLALRERDRAAAYLLPADLEHIDTIIDKVKAMGGHVEFLPEGSFCNAKQYCCTGLREADGHDKDITVDLLSISDLDFLTGAYRITASDFRQIPLALLMEPDVTDTVGTKGSLFQQGLLDYDRETGRFPLYRIEWT